LESITKNDDLIWTKIALRLEIMERKIQQIKFIINLIFWSKFLLLALIMAEVGLVVWAASSKFSNPLFILDVQALKKIKKNKFSSSIDQRNK